MTTYPIQPYPIHMVCMLFPELDDREKAALRADIKAHGQADPILLFDGQVIDGRHRQEACNRLGIEPVYAQWTPKTPDNPDAVEAELKAFVSSKNLVRRHLTVGQRSMIAAILLKTKIPVLIKSCTEKEIKEELPKLPKDPVQICTSIVSRSEVKVQAESMKVSPRSVRSAMKVLENGSEALKNAVSSGKITLNKAVEVSVLPKTEQNRVVETDAKSITVSNSKPKDMSVPSLAIQKRSRTSTKSMVDVIDDLKKEIPNFAFHKQANDLINSLISVLGQWAPKGRWA